MRAQNSQSIAGMKQWLSFYVAGDIEQMQSADVEYCMVAVLPLSPFQLSLTSPSHRRSSRIGRQLRFRWDERQLTHPMDQTSTPSLTPT